MFELSGDDEINNRAEAEEHDTESLIQAIFDAADNRDLRPTKAQDEALAKAIDRAMSHAYAEGRSDQDADHRAAYWERAEREREDRKEREMEIVRRQA